MKQTGLVAFLLFIFLFVSHTSYAQSNLTQPSKESLLAHWETSLKKNPYTVKLEKVDDSGLYNYETTLFPYKGRLQVLNAIVQKELDYYYDYDASEAASMMGAVEIELLDAPEDLEEKYFISLSVWRKQNFFYFIPSAQKWMTANEYDLYQQYLSVNTNEQENGSESEDISFLSFTPAIFIIVFWVGFAIWCQKENKKQIEKSLELQREQIELLRKLAEK